MWSSNYSAHEKNLHNYFFDNGFFDSFNEDRKYNSLQLSSIFDGIISDGVYATYGDYFLVSPVSGMGIKVGTGRAWLDHTWTLNDADYPLTVEDAEVVLKRIDTVIIEVDRSNSGRINRLRFDPVNQSGVAVTVASIRLVPAVK